MNSLSQIEESLKRGYRRAVLGFSKSRQYGTTTYFIEIIKNSFNEGSERIYVIKEEYRNLQELIDKYDAIYKEKKNKEKARKEQSRLDKEAREKEVVKRKSGESFNKDLIKENDKNEEDEEIENYLDYSKDEIDLVFESLPLGNEEIDEETEDEIDKKIKEKIREEIRKDIEDTDRIEMPKEEIKPEEIEETGIKGGIENIIRDIMADTKPKEINEPNHGDTNESNQP